MKIKHYPIRYRIQSQINHAIKMGILIRPDLYSICNGNNGKIISHHPNYKNPLHFIWVCRSCHLIIHAIDKDRKPILKLDKIKREVLKKYSQNHKFML